MKIYILLLLNILLVSINANAQAAGTGYYLPKTEMRFQLLIEKTSYTPGEYAVFSERFLKRKAKEKKYTEYNIVGLKMYTTSIPDSAKSYTVPMDKKHIIFNVELDRSGILLAINTKPKQMPEHDFFTPYPKTKMPNPHDFMSEEILTAGSTAKMAELTAREIYDIRTSRSELTRGEAEYMPKDGDQLKIMLANLDRQESILLQTFLGVTQKDTIEQEIVYCPAGSANEDDAPAEKEVLFRFSKKFGLVDANDLAGAPYYLEIEDLKVIPELQTAVDGKKRSKNDIGVMVNMPGKIKATVFEGNRPMTSFELYAAQYGRLESLSSELFSKKMLSKLQLNPITGYVETLETEPLD